MKIKLVPRINIRLKGFYINFGWYPGNPFYVFQTSIINVIDGLRNEVFVELFSIQILFFVFAIGWYKD